MYIQGKNGQIIIAGVAVRDAEMSIVGANKAPLTKFSLAVGKDEAGNSKFSAVLHGEAWEKKAAHIKKLDNVAVMGVIEKHTYTDRNGEEKTSEQLTCDWIDIASFQDTTNIVTSSPAPFVETMQPVNDDEIPF